MFDFANWDLLPWGRASFMLDLVALAMLAIIPLQFWSIRLVRRKHYRLHQLVQLSTALVLFIAVILFEVDMRLNGWRHLAEDSRYYPELVEPLLLVHLVFAISTTLLLLATVIHGLSFFGWRPEPKPGSGRHRLLGWLTVADLTATAITGWTFYILAFLC